MQMLIFFNLAKDFFLEYEEMSTEKSKQGILKRVQIKMLQTPLIEKYDTFCP
jgi:hypothetical protein